MTIEELQAELLKMQEEVKENKALIDTLSTSITEKDKEIADIREHNQKLYIKAMTSSKEEKEEVKEVTPFCIDEATYNLLSEDEKNELKELMEEE